MLETGTPGFGIKVAEVMFHASGLPRKSGVVVKSGSLCLLMLKGDLGSGSFKEFLYKPQYAPTIYPDPQKDLKIRSPRTMAGIT